MGHRATSDLWQKIVMLSQVVGECGVEGQEIANVNSLGT